MMHGSLVTYLKIPIIFVFIMNTFSIQSASQPQGIWFVLPGTGPQFLVAQPSVYEQPLHYGVDKGPNFPQPRSFLSSFNSVKTIR